MDLSFVFGLNCAPSNHVTFYTENIVIYTIGLTLVIFNIDRQTQRILPLNITNGSISSLSISNDLILVGTRCETFNATISIFNLTSGKLKRTYKAGELGTREFISAAFSVDGKHIVAQGVQPDWNIYIWTIDKAKLILTAKSSIALMNVRKMSINPFDTSITICVTGNGYIRVLKPHEGSLKVLSQIHVDQVSQCL